MQKSRIYHFLLVLIQFGGIFYFFKSGAIIPGNFVSLLLMILSLLTGFWAIISMNSKTLTVMPDVRKEASLVTTGPYRYVRHPMYCAVLLFLAALLVNDFNLERAGVYVAVLIVLLLKTVIEERQLQVRFAEYAAYQQKTKRFIPFLL